MNPRVNYEMTQDDLDQIKKACKPVPCIMIGGSTAPSQQENANRAWASLGEKMGFDSMSVRPAGKGMRFFTAVPSETDIQRDEREELEEQESRQKEINELKKESIRIDTRLEELNSKD